MPKREKRLPKAILSCEEIEQLLVQPDVSEPLGLRDRTIMETFFSTGIRRQEMSRLSVYDIDFSREVVSVRLGKGNKDRVVPIGERALSWVQRYLDEVRPSLLMDMKETTLFLSYQGQPLVPDSLSRLVRENLQQSGVQKSGGCHLFRHSMATSMLENGADIRFIQELLGHENLETTQIYTRVSIRTLKTIHDATHPMAKIKRSSHPGRGCY